jgi:hypothetical protein
MAKERKNERLAVGRETFGIYLSASVPVAGLNIGLLSCVVMDETN